MNGYYIQYLHKGVISCIFPQVTSKDDTYFAMLFT